MKYLQTEDIKVDILVPVLIAVMAEVFWAFFMFSGGIQFLKDKQSGAQTIHMLGKLQAQLYCGLWELKHFSVFF